MVVRFWYSALGVVSGIILATAIFSFQSPAFAQARPSKELAVIPANKDNDLKFYQADGRIQRGVEALEHMTSAADLVLWVAGNQFFCDGRGDRRVSEDASRPDRGANHASPGLILSAIQGGGWVYNGKEYRGTPDVYASVNLGHLRQLKAAGVMSKY